jgi:hypothetical protein
MNLPCDDGDICTDNDICLSTSNGPATATGCRASPASGTLCDDANTCTTNDVCTASPRRMTLPSARGLPLLVSHAMTSQMGTLVCFEPIVIMRSASRAHPNLGVPCSDNN